MDFARPHSYNRQGSDSVSMAYVALYIVTLFASAGLVGLFARQVLGGLGYIRGFDMELLAMASVAAAFAAAQLAYMAFLRLFRPTQSGAPLIAEGLSQLTALVLIPYQLQMPVPWPHPLLEKLAPLVFFGAFLTAHLFFKLTSLYASIRGEPHRRFQALPWACAAALAVVVALLGLQRWGDQLAHARPHVAEDAQPCDVGGIWRQARLAPEGAAVEDVIEPVEGGAGLAFYFAIPTDAPEKGAPVAAAAKDTKGKSDAASADSVYVTLRIDGDETVEQEVMLSLRNKDWAMVRLPPNQVPANPRRCSVTWQAKKPPKWMELTPIQPLTTSTRSLLYSGPDVFCERTEAGGDNIILIAVEGLGTRHMSGFGYRRKTTPGLDAWVRNTNAFPNAYTPIPDGAAACMTLLTGLTPLRHGVMGSAQGSGAAGLQTMAQALSAQQFATAAFTEGDSPEDADLLFGSGFERGFGLFDAACPGTRATLAKAEDWINTHADGRFFVFIRLRELRDPQWADRYAPGFVVEVGAQPRPVDVYDSALAALDRDIGAFLKSVRTGAVGQKTAIAVTSTYGYDFFTSGDAQQPLVGLEEESLRVPLLLYVPGEPPEQRKEIIALEDVCPTLMARARVPLRQLADGQDLMQHPRPRYVISMYGEPLALSLRYAQWRFTWNSGYLPASGFRGTDQMLELVHVDRMRTRGTKMNDLANNQEIARKYRSYLSEWLQKQVKAAAATQSPAVAATK